MFGLMSKKIVIEPWHEIFNNLVFATSKGSDQPDQSLCWSLKYSMTDKLLTEPHLRFLSLKEAAQARLNLHLSKYHIVGNHVSLLNYNIMIMLTYIAYLDLR